MDSIKATMIARSLYRKHKDNDGLVRIRRIHMNEPWKDYLTSIVTSSIIYDILNTVQPFDYIGCIGEDVVEFEVNYLLYPLYIKIEREKQIISFHYSTSKKQIKLKEYETYHMVRSGDLKFRIGLGSFNRVMPIDLFTEINGHYALISGEYLINYIRSLNERYQRETYKILEEVKYQGLQLDLDDSTLITFNELLKEMPDKDKLLIYYIMDRLNSSNVIETQFDFLLLSGVVDKNKYIKEYLMQLRGFLPETKLRLLENKTNEF